MIKGNPLWKSYLSVGVISLLLSGIAYVILSTFEGEVDIFGEQAAWGSNYRYQATGTKEYEKIGTDWKQGIPGDPGMYWFRCDVHLGPNLEASAPSGLFAQMGGAFELYWDGVLIGKNGQVSDVAAAEVPGNIHSLFFIPSALDEEGSHTVTLLISNFMAEGLWEDEVAIVAGSYLKWSKTLLIITTFLNMLSGIFLVTAIYYFFIYFISYRESTYLLFGLLCVSLFSLTVFEFVKYFYNYSYLWGTLIIKIKAVNVTVIGGLLLLYILFRFKVPNKGWVFAIGLGLVLGYWVGMDELSEMVVYSLVTWLVLSLGVVGYGMYHRMAGSMESTLGLLACGLVFHPHEHSIYLGFGFFVIYHLYSMSRQLKRRNREHRESQLKSSRLEVELLKRNIQPHFLMNTLTTLMAMIVESPKLAVTMIQALAEEFHVLSEISGKELIPIRQEITLCESLLKVMSLRKEVEYTLNTQSIDFTEKVPPAIFHTLIENGIVHNEPISGKLDFYLSFEKKASLKKYTLIAGGTPEPRVNGSTEEGTGLRYIKARLEESYAQHWQLSNGEEALGWKTEITLYH
ncbi:histidine kinase [Rapidithrix thailandica]|uniref:Histidine kinase n=1 Tax=Rapidithrix thailandica TaxID=413964 RepID=A0AAW9SEZ1_9BACT